MEATLLLNISDDSTECYLQLWTDLGTKYLSEQDYEGNSKVCFTGFGYAVLYSGYILFCSPTNS